MTTTTPNIYYASDLASLNTTITNVNQLGASETAIINIFNENTSNPITISVQSTITSLNSAATVTISGPKVNSTISGGSSGGSPGGFYQGFVISAGNVVFENLTFENLSANGSFGNMGAGGAIYALNPYYSTQCSNWTYGDGKTPITSPTQLTVNNCNFKSCHAVGSVACLPTPVMTGGMGGSGGTYNRTDNSEGQFGSNGYGGGGGPQTNTPNGASGTGGIGGAFGHYTSSSPASNGTDGGPGPSGFFGYAGGFGGSGGGGGGGASGEEGLNGSNGETGGAGGNGGQGGNGGFGSGGGGGGGGGGAGGGGTFPRTVFGDCGAGGGGGQGGAGGVAGNYGWGGAAGSVGTDGNLGVNGTDAHIRALGDTDGNGGGTSPGGNSGCTGAGAGFGGAIFMMGGNLDQYNTSAQYVPNLTLTNVIFSGNTAVAGSRAASAAGNDIFLQGYGNYSISGGTNPPEISDEKQSKIPSVTGIDADAIDALGYPINGGSRFWTNSDDTSNC